MPVKPVTYDPKKDKVDKDLRDGVYRVEDTLKRTEVDIYGPMAFWIGLLILGLVVEFVVGPLAKAAGTPSQAFAALANYILYLPGAIILPLIVSVWVGERVGSSGRNVHEALRVGLLNAIYVAFVYIVAIFIIYLLIYYADSGALPANFTVNSFVTFLVAIPAVIVLVLIPLFSTMSAARHS